MTHSQPQRLFAPALQLVAALCAVPLASIFLTGCELTWDDSKEYFRASRYTEDEGWIDPELPSVDDPAAVALRTEAQNDFDGRRYQAGVEKLHDLQNDFGGTRSASDPRTYFLISECYFYLGDYDRAHEYYMKTLRRSPAEDVFNQTLNRIYTIGLAFLHGRAKRSFLGVSYRSPTHGVEILLGEKGLLTRFPLQRYSSAVWEISEYYFNKRQYSEAEKVYEQLVRQFPESEWAEQAEYKLAVSVYNQVRGVEYDQEPLRRARRRFVTYRAHYPRGNYNEKVREYLRDIAEMEAQHDLSVAKYYLRESRPRAARFYLRSVLLNNPKTDAAREARPMFQQLSEYGLEEPTDLGGSSDDQGK